MNQPEREMAEKLIDAIKANTEIQRQSINMLEKKLADWCLGFFMLFLSIAITLSCLLHR